MLIVWKKLFTGNFSEKRVSPQKVALETLSPFLIAAPTTFRQKTVFSTDFWAPPAPALVLKKNYQTEPFSRNKNFPGEVYLGR